MSEEWRDVKGFEGLYKVSDLGNVARYVKDHLRPLKQYVNDRGYHRVMLSNGEIKKSCQVHRLVGLSFVSGFEAGLQINHINGIKSDNSAINLEWVTASQNIQHAFDTGLNKGQCNAAAITGRLGSSFKGLVEATEIKGDRKFTMEGNKHFRECGFNPQSVYACVNGKLRKHKGFRFKRVPLSPESESILLRSGTHDTADKAG